MNLHPLKLRIIYLKYYSDFENKYSCTEIIKSLKNNIVSVVFKEM